MTAILLAVFGFGLATTNYAQAAKNDSVSEAATPAFTEGFEDITTLPGKGWFIQNNSVPLGTRSWFQGIPTTFPAQAGPTNSYISVNFDSTGDVGTINNWLVTPVIEFRNGDVITFYTRTRDTAPFADRLQVRLSTNGSSTNVGTGATESNVGDFTVKLLDINPNYVSGPAGGYPDVWTQYTVTISGLSAATNGRLAFRYFVESGGFSGDNSYQIGIDTFAYTPTTGGTPRDAPVDFNGDGKTDYAVYRNLTGATNGQLRWFYNLNVPNSPTVALDWGLATDTVITEDFDGDLKDDIAVWRPGVPTVAAFYILNSQTNTARVEAFGQTGDDPTVVGDYSGDGKADLAVYRAGANAGAQSIWFYRSTPNGATVFTPWGLGNDFPSPGDYDGDGRNDFVVQRANGDGQKSAFWTRLATGVVLPVQPFAQIIDSLVPGDYDGDGKTDYASVRDANGTYNWYWRRSSDGVVVGGIPFGASATDDLTQGDYDGDGRTDIAVWRNNGQFIWRSTATGAVTFFRLGASTDFPVAFFNVH
ncbi:MAG: VCBS repeat-containing protein [Acidobacteriota bacterium]|nr:VCBS repeat-containing protein [Acidobacteriota bacterium]